MDTAPRQGCRMGLLHVGLPHVTGMEVLGLPPPVLRDALVMQCCISYKSLVESSQLLVFLCKSRHVGLEQQQRSMLSLCSALRALGSTIKLNLGCRHLGKCQELVSTHL